jgi:hypothetical protein
MNEWVGELRFTAEVALKLRLEHNLTPEQVRSAVAYGAHDSAGWQDHVVYGRRFILTGSDDNGRLVAYLRLSMKKMASGSV